MMTIYSLMEHQKLPKDAMKYEYAPYLLYMDGSNQIGYEITDNRFRIGGFKAENQEIFSIMMDALVEEAKASGKSGIHAYKNWGAEEIKMMDAYGFSQRYSDGSNTDMVLVFEKGEK